MLFVQFSQIECYKYCAVSVYIYTYLIKNDYILYYTRLYIIINPVGIIIYIFYVHVILEKYYA